MISGIVSPVATLLDWYRDGADVACHGCLCCRPTLVTSAPVSTYWYLQATPELLAVAARRLEQHHGGAAMTALAPTIEAFFT